MRLIRWISSSLQIKLLTMFIILTCIPLIAVGLISYQKSFKTVFDNSKAAAMLSADQLARDLDTQFIDTRKLLEISQNAQVLHFLFSQEDTYEDTKQILRTMDSYRQTYKYDSVLNITMVNLYGRGISERKGLFQLEKNPLRNSHFTYLTNHPDEVLMIPPSEASLLDRIDGFQYNRTNVISIMAAVKQQITHEVIGFIAIDLDDKVVKQFCDNVTIGETGFYFVVDAAGQPIFTPSTLKEHAKLPSPADLSHMLNGADTNYIDSSEGKPKFVYMSPSRMTGWSIVGYVPLQEIVEEANSIRQLIIITVVLSFIFAVSLHFFISYRLTHPLHLLKSKMQLAASGYLEAKVTPKGNDEIALLGNSFNTMLSKIRELLDQSIKEQEEIKKAELRALQAQINPHFLYNTLDSIVWMAEAGKNHQVIQLVQSLSKLFRISLSKGRDWIMIHKEVEHVHSYLVIQQMRYRDILEYEIDVDDRLKPYPILKMTLQPIVENALYHGLKNKRRKGLIRIAGRIADNGEMMIVVEDDGIGMSPEKLEQTRHYLSNKQLPEQTGNEVSGGFGLHNVQQRIQLYYGSNYGVSIDSVQNEGTKVSIRIPLTGGYG
ncbi:sensor histidine kinase [Bacillus sp. 3255]|uniref:sensor histidine kinase n=1 Tax=Bacillus sp. 3255 TaxID=2817904 RepID=UPI0028620084|nr:sensor histidine kinase [Bacillus sp. 3255]MDR6881325.1 two-component system sensor histidine kinase YesM [Bacillus sp. 3255]